MSFSADFIDKVREANDIVEIIGQDTQLKGGSQQMGRCPFPDHNEKTPSFSVSASKQVYHCFGCKKQGNIFHYLRDMRGLSFPEAVEYLANKAGIPIPKDQKSVPESNEQKDKRRLLIRANHLAARFFSENLKKLPSTHLAVKYIASRGFTQEIIDKFLIGYAPNEWEALREFLQQQKIPARIAEEVGLIKQRKAGDGHFDIFRNRLIFPIVSHKEEFVGFGGRVIDKNDKPKYLNSPDSDVFHKGSLFYGLDQSARYIRSEDHAVVVEGYTDYLALFQAGIRCVVATLGTAMTDKHARLLKRYSKNVFVLFDGDEAGQNAATRSLEILLKAGCYPKGLTLPEGKDPDEFLKANGPEALRKELAQAPDLFEQVFRRFREGYSGAASEKVQLVERLAPVLLSVEDRLLLDLYVESVARQLSLDPKFVWKALRQSRESQPESARLKASPQKADIFQEPRDVPQQWIESTIDIGKASKVEVELINAALLNQKALEWVIESKAVEHMITPNASKVLEIIAERYGQEPGKFDNLTAYLQTIVEPHEHVARHLVKPLSELNPEGAKKLINDCVKRLKTDRLRQKQRELAQRLQNEQGFSTPEELEQIMNIHRDRHSLDKD